MLGWFRTPLGRIFQGILGIALLWLGIEQATTLGLLVMMTGLVITVAAAAPPPLRERRRWSRAGADLPHIL